MTVSRADAVPGSPPGRFYVDLTCIWCGACSEVAPAFFARAGEETYAVVVRQPRTPHEVAEVHRAMEECPTSSIQDLGS